MSPVRHLNRSYHSLPVGLFTLHQEKGVHTPERTDPQEAQTGGRGSDWDLLCYARTLGRVSPKLGGKNIYQVRMSIKVLIKSIYCGREKHSW